MLNFESSLAASAFPDPMDGDGPDDAPVVLTRRRLCRLALVATEVGARFERDGVQHDPMAWMLAPRELFDGTSAIDACLELEGCVRALVVHGLGLGLDADPAEIDALVADGVSEDGGGAGLPPAAAERLDLAIDRTELCPA